MIDPSFSHNNRQPHRAAVQSLAVSLYAANHLPTDRLILVETRSVVRYTNTQTSLLWSLRNIATNLHPSRTGYRIYHNTINLSDSVLFLRFVHTRGVALRCVAEPRSGVRCRDAPQPIRCERTYIQSIRPLRPVY